MPKPSPDFDLITVEWRAANDRGDAQVGSLRITPNISRAVVNQHATTPIGVYLTPRTVTISPTQVTIDSVMYNVGYASFQLLASNDPDIFTDSSEWFSYTVTETLTNGATGETFNLFVDKDAVGGTINLQSVDRGIPASTPLTPVSAVTVSAFATLTSRVDDLEAGGGGTVPTGGSTGQVLAKVSGTDYDIQWADGAVGPAGPAGQGVPTGGTTGQVLAKLSATNYDTEWTDGAQGPPGPAGADGAPGADGADGADGQGVPVGGTAGQVLAKASGTNFDTEWADLAGGSGTKVGDRIMYVAAAGESAGVKAACDYVCDGTADEVQINAALAAVGSESISHGNGTGTPNTNGGKVVLVGRNFNIAGAILVPTQTRLTSLYGEFATRISCASSYTPGASGGMIELATTNTQYVEIDGFTLDGNNVSTCGVYIGVAAGQEYDAYIKVHDLYMWDIGQDGLSVNNISGGRCRGNHFWSMRMINTGRYGVFVNGPDSFYDRIDVGSAGSHGFYIQHANNRFVNCKSWYSDGSGFYFTTASRDNQLSACESQDNEFHGYHIQGRQNNLAACKADSNSYNGSPSTAITGRSYYGFYVAGNYTTIDGTASDKNESSRGLRQVYGVFITSGVTALCNVTTYQHFTGSFSNAGTLHGHIVGT